VEGADLLRHLRGSLREVPVAVSVHSLHGVRSVDRSHVLREDLESLASHGTDFEELDPGRVAVRLQLSHQVVLTSLHPEMAIAWTNTRQRTFATSGRIPEVASTAMPVNFRMLDLPPLPRLPMMTLGMATAAGMMSHGALVMMTGALVTYGTLQQMTVPRLTVLTHSKEEVRAEERERVVRKEKDDM